MKLKKKELRHWLERISENQENRNRYYRELLFAINNKMPIDVKITYDMHSEKIGELDKRMIDIESKYPVLKQYFEIFYNEVSDKIDEIWETLYKSEQEVNQYLHALDSELKYIKNKVKNQNIVSDMKKYVKKIGGSLFDKD